MEKIEQIKVSEGISERFRELEPSVKTEIINIGTCIYFNGLRWVFEEKCNSEIEKAKIEFQMKDKAFEEYKEKLRDEIEYQYEIKFNDREQNNNLILGYKNETIKRYEDVIEDQKYKIEKLEAEVFKAQNLNVKIDSLMGKGSILDNASKGDFGENVVANVIQKNYPASELIDKSAETAKGDLLWNLNKIGFNCLVEVKNVQYVRTSEISKFERDLLLNSENGECNCGLFVSLKTEYIQNKGNLCFEIYNGVPVIYVSNIMNNMDAMKIACDLLVSVQPLLKKDISTIQDNQYDIIKEFVNTVSSELLQRQNNIQLMKQNIDNMMSVVYSEEKLNNNQMKKLTELSKQFTWMQDIGENIVDLKDSLISFTEDYYNEHQKWPNRDEYIQNGFPANKFRKELSIKNIRQMCKVEST